MYVGDSRGSLGAGLTDIKRPWKGFPWMLLRVKNWEDSIVSDMFNYVILEETGWAESKTGKGVGEETRKK